jgi:hypothetical protein
VNRITKIATLAAASLATLLGTAAGANAATANADGSITVTKGDIQSAMGWNNAAWDTAIGAPKGVITVGDLITTTSGVANPVDVPGGWLTLNGQIVANYPSDEYYSNSWTNPENWCNGYTVVSSVWTNDANTATITPIRNAQNKVTGYKVSAPAPDVDGYVHYTRHTTGTCDNGNSTFVYHATSRWPASVAGVSGVTDVKVNGKPVTIG